MNKKLRQILSIAFIDACLVPLSCFASEGQHAAPSIASLLLPAINFTLYILSALWLYKKVVRPLLVQQAKNVKESLVQASKAIASAQDDHKQTVNRRQNLEEEKKQVVEAYAHEAEKISEIIKTRASDSVAAIHSAVSRQINNEMIQAQKDIRQDVVNQAISLAEKQIALGLSAETDKNLRREVLKAL